MKVKGKAFLFMSRPEEGGLSLSVKLRASHGEALLMPFAAPSCEPTGPEPSGE